MKQRVVADEYLHPNQSTMISSVGPLTPSEKHDMGLSHSFQRDNSIGINTRAAAGTCLVADVNTSGMSADKLVQTHIETAPCASHRQRYLHELASHVFFQSSQHNTDINNGHMLNIFNSVLRHPEFEPNYCFGTFLAYNVVVFVDALPDFLESLLNRGWRLAMNHPCGRHIWMGLIRMPHPQRDTVMKKLQINAAK